MATATRTRKSGVDFSVSTTKDPIRKAKRFNFRVIVWHVAEVLDDLESFPEDMCEPNEVACYDNAAEACNEARRINEVFLTVGFPCLEGRWATVLVD